MPLPVRVIGRIDLAESVRESVRGAGFDAEVVTAAPLSVYRGTPPAEGVDVVIATSLFDLPLWDFAKARHPLRPMVAVADRRHERALRGAASRRNGPDAYVTWPATPEELAAAIDRAEASAARRRAWSAADASSALVKIGLLTMSLGGVFGLFAVGVGLLSGLRFAWNLKWQAAGGVLLTVAGGAGIADQLASWLR